MNHAREPPRLHGVRTMRTGYCSSFNAHSNSKHSLWLHDRKKERPGSQLRNRFTWSRCTGPFHQTAKINTVAG